MAERGTYNGDVISHAEIAARLKISRAMVYYLEKRALAKMRIALMDPGDLTVAEQGWLRDLASGCDPLTRWQRHSGKRRGRTPVWSLRAMGLVDRRGQGLTRRGHEVAAQISGMFGGKP